MSTKTIFMSTVLLLTVISMSKAQLTTNEKILEESIKYHDPKNEWRIFKGEFLVTLSKGSTENITYLEINNGSSTTLWSEVLLSKDTLTGGFIGDSCIVKHNGINLIPKGQMEDYLLDCKSIIERTNYWVYMFGLPMKLNDEALAFVGSPKKVILIGHEYWQLTATYDPGKSEYWQFYFDVSSFAFKGARYFSSKLNGDSEYVVYQEEQKIGNLLIPTKHSWYLFNEKYFIGSEKLSLYTD